MLDEAFRKRFMQKVKIGPECWEWTAARGHFGYGQIWMKERRTMWDAHRVAWILKYGDIPSGMCVLHKCDNPACVRIAHLYLGTKKDNARDRKIRKRHWIDRDREAALAHLHKIAFNGKSLGNRKLTINQVRLIRTSDESNRILGQRFGVDSDTVRLVRTGETWKGKE